MPGSESAPNNPNLGPTSGDDIDKLADFYLNLDAGNNSGENHPDTPDSHEAGGTLGSPEGNLNSDKLAKIKQAMGGTALIATSLNKEDYDNARKELLEFKTNQSLSESKILRGVTMVPIIGRVIKAGIAASHRKEINSVLSNNSLSEAYAHFGVASESQILNSDTTSTVERAQQILNNAGYSDDNKIDIATSRLDQNDRVEKMNQETSDAIKKTLNEYYSALKAGGNQEELSRKFDEQINATFTGKENLGTSINLSKQKAGIEELVKNKEITERDLKTFLDQNVSLYKTDMKEGIYTKKKVDSIIGAVAAAGFTGGLIAVVAGREGRKGLRSAANAAGIASAGVAGAAVGGVFGGVRGWEKAKAKLSESEIKAVNNFDESTPEPTTEPTPEATPKDIAEPKPPVAPKRPETDDPDALADWYEALDKYDKAKKEYDIEVEKYAKVKKETGERSPEAQTEKGDKKTGLLRSINNFKRKLTKEETLLSEIETLRGRKEVSVFTDELEKLMGEDTPESKTALMDLYANIIARGRFSSDKHIDLIKYKDDDRSKLEAMLHNAEGKMGFDVNQAFADENSPLNEAIRSQYNILNNNFEKAKKKENEFKLRSAAVDAITGAIIGGVGGAIFQTLRDSGVAAAIGNFLGITSTDSEIDSLHGDRIELAEDPDGGFTVKLGNQELIGEGDTKGIDFNSDGTLTTESEEMLKNAGIEFEAHQSEPIEIARSNMNIREFFNAENREANNLTEIASRSWVTDGTGRDLLSVGNTHMDGEGNIIMQVVPTQNSDVSMDDMKMVFTVGDGNIDNAVVVDVNPDGTVEIPAGSPVASLFNGDNYQGGYAELAKIDANGNLQVYNTIGDGHPDINTISVPNSDVTYTDGYTFTVDGQSQEVSLPEEIAATAKLEAINGIESARGLGETVYNEANGDATTLQTNTGEAVEVEHFEHHGGYSDIYDSYFGEKDGVYNSGASLVRQILGDEANGLSSREADQLFLEKINSGEISEGDVVENYLNAIGNSPEALVTTRAMMGDFMMDLDGDGTLELIDTQDEINVAADILGGSDPESYDNFVNDTYNIFYEKIAGGNIRFVDQSQEQYQYTTWGVLGDNNNILQRIGVVGDRPTDGVGIIFTDKDGRSIYDEDTVRKLWHLPENYDINYVADRLDCIQKTARGFFGESTGDEPTGTESTGTEPTGDESTGTEPTGDEPTGTEPTGDEPTGTEPTGDEPTGTEPTGTEPTGDEPTGTEPTGTEPTGDEPTGDEPTGDEITPKTDNPHAGDETDLPVTPPQEDDYVQPTTDNHVDPDTQPGSQVNDAPTDNSAYNPVDHDTSSGNDTQSSYSNDTSKWQGDKSGGSGGGNSGGGGSSDGGSSGGGNSSGGGGGGSSAPAPAPTPSNADPGSASNNVDHSDEELANILNDGGEQKGEL